MKYFSFSIIFYFLILTSCSKAFQANSAGTANPVVTPPLELTRSAGCSIASPATGTLNLTALDGNGTTRNFRVMIPSTYSTVTSYRVSFLYHGAGGSENDGVYFGVQDAPGALEAGIFVFPRGITYLSYGIGWDDNCNGRDMVLFDNILNYLKTNYCVNPSKTFVGGFSWGGDHSTALACCRANVIRSVAVAAASDEFSDPANYMTYVNPVCATTTTKPAIRFTHATTADGSYAAPLFDTTSKLFRYFNSCSNSTVPSSPSPCVAFTGCGASSPLIECSYPSLGHTLNPNWGVDTWNFIIGLP